MFGLVHLSYWGHQMAGAGEPKLVLKTGVPQIHLGNLLKSQMLWSRLDH